MPFTMRLLAYSAVSCLLLSATARADVDFNVLLAQLPNLESDSDSDELIDPGIDAESANGKDPEGEKPSPEESIATPPGEALLESPSDLLAPSGDDEMPSAAGPTPPEYRGRTPNGPPVASEDVPSMTPYTDTAPDTRLVPYSILDIPPDAAAAEATIDFDQMLESRNHPSPDPALGHGSMHSPNACGCTGSRHYCQPHRRPSLPPPATLESMYHCKPCYRDVWAGYEADRQKECDKLHKHLHERCDCLTPKAEPCAAVVCNEGSCDESPSFLSHLFRKTKALHQHRAQVGNSECGYDE